MSIETLKDLRHAHEEIAMEYRRERKLLAASGYDKNVVALTAAISALEELPGLRVNSEPYEWLLEPFAKSSSSNPPVICLLDNVRLENVMFYEEADEAIDKARGV